MSLLPWILQASQCFLCPLEQTRCNILPRGSFISISKPCLTNAALRGVIGVATPQGVDPQHKMLPYSRKHYGLNKSCPEKKRVIRQIITPGNMFSFDLEQKTSENFSAGSNYMGIKLQELVKKEPHLNFLSDVHSNSYVGNSKGACPIWSWRRFHTRINIFAFNYRDILTAAHEWAKGHLARLKHTSERKKINGKKNDKSTGLTILFEWKNLKS